jgi:NitT/TauT family transport system ATP-binding protein
LIVDDTKYPKYGNSVISFRTPVIDAYPETIRGFLRALDKAIEVVNADPTKYQDLLVEQKLIPAPLIDSYQIPPFPQGKVPSEAQWEDVLAWAQDKGLVSTDISYNDSVTYSFLPDTMISLLQERSSTSPGVIDNSMIQFESVTYTYPNSVVIFQDFNWYVGHGEAWAVLGPSGCGKTTLLYLLAGLRFPTFGRILIDGQDLDRPRPHTGLILQEYGLLPWATVRQNAELGLQIRTFYGPDGKHAPTTDRPAGDVNPWLSRLGILSQSEKYPGQISGGQRQRTAIARTLALQPDLLLMDEPFSSLDAPTREGLQNLTLELVAEQKLTTVIVTTPSKNGYLRLKISS